MEICGEHGGILFNVPVATFFLHVSRAEQKFSYIDTDHSRGKQPDGRKFGKSSADVIGNIESFKPFFLSDFYKIALAGGGSGDHMIFSLISEFLFKYVHYNKELRHCFARSAALCYNVEHGFFEIQNLQHCSHSFRIDIVLDVKTRMFPFKFGKFVVAQMAKSLERRHGSQCGTAYTENHEIIEILPYLPCGIDNIPHHFLLIYGKIHPAGHTFAAACHNAPVSASCIFHFFFEVFFGKAFFTDEFAHHIIIIEFKFQTSAGF